MERQEPEDDLLVLLPVARRPEEAAPVGVLRQSAEEIAQRPVVERGADLLRGGAAEALRQRIDRVEIGVLRALVEDGGAEPRVVESLSVSVRQVRIGPALEVADDAGETEVVVPDLPPVEGMDRQQPLPSVRHQTALAARLGVQEDGGRRQTQDQRFEETGRLAARPAERPQGLRNEDLVALDPADQIRRRRGTGVTGDRRIHGHPLVVLPVPVEDRRHCAGFGSPGFALAAAESGEGGGHCAFSRSRRMPKL